MYAQVVVLTYQPPNIDTYTYEVPKKMEGEVKVGQLVSVPFGRRNPTGIVIHLRGVRTHLGGEIEIKLVSSIVFPTPILLPYQIELLKWMADYYHAPMVNCLEAILPKIPRRSLMVYSSSGRKITPINDERSTINQTLVLVPNINRIAQTLAAYPQAKNYAIYHNELRMSQKFAVWQKILSGNIDYIFGSRSAIFAPCPNLGKIIIFDEHDGAYKDERSPYYDTLTAAEKISELTGCKIQIIDSSPRITTYFVHKKDLSLGVQPLKGVGPQVQVVSMLAEKAAGNRSPISDILQTYIKLGFKKKKKILLFLNKKTESGHIYCSNCKHSDFASTQPETCPNCASSNIWFNTVNVTTLAALVKQIVPDANVKNDIHLRGVKTSLARRESRRTHFGGGKDGEIDIATATVFYRLTPQKYDLVAHIRTDSILAISDFTSTERLYWQITDLKKLTRGLLLLQTYNPENEVLKAAAGNNYLRFYAHELAMRKNLKYPPFALLIKLTLKGKRDEILESKAEKLANLLKNSSLITNHSSPSILGPFKPAFSQKGPKYNIIAKMPTGSYSLREREKAIGKIQPLLVKVPKEWQIEVGLN